MAEAQKVTAPSSRVIVDAVALQQALRAAKAIAPSNPKTEHAVIGVQVPTADNEAVVVTAMNPELHLMMSVAVPTIDVDLADERDAHIEIDRKQLDGLLSMPRKTPKQDDPWPEMCWDVTPTRIKQTDAGVLLGEERTVYRVEGPEHHVLGDIHKAMTKLTTAAEPLASGQGRVDAAQMKPVAAAIGHLEHGWWKLLPLEPQQGQLASALWTNGTAIIHAATPDKDQDRQEKNPTETSFDDDATPTRSESIFKIVPSNPPGGIA